MFKVINKKQNVANHFFKSDSLQPRLNIQGMGLKKKKDKDETCACSLERTER